MADQDAEEAMAITVPGLDRPLKFAHSVDHEFWRRFSRGEWEPENLSLLVRLLHGDSRFVDVGAWLGPMTLIAARRGARVVAFEPDPVARSLLDANLDLNADVRDRVKVIPAALGANTGEARLSSDRLGDSMSSLVRDGEYSSVVRTIDAAAWSRTTDFTSADVLKIDTEGGEFVIVPRLRRAFRSHRPVLLLSVHAYPVLARFAAFPAPLARSVAHVVSGWNRVRLLASTRRYANRWVWDTRRWRSLRAIDACRFAFNLADQELLLADRDVFDSEGTM